MLSTRNYAWDKNEAPMVGACNPPKKGPAMIWAKRFYEVESPYVDEFNRFEKEYLGRGGPAEMMMVEVASHKPHGHLVVIALPGEADMTRYPGFEVIDADQLPEAATLLIGRNAEFERRFKYATTA
jgi:hypothetical protein